MTVYPHFQDLFKSPKITIPQSCILTVEKEKQTLQKHIGSEYFSIKKKRHAN